jgi:dedicator of cytokinesis protein 3
MKSVMSTPNTKSYRSFLKVWHLFFRFIIRSRELDRARGVGLDATSAHIEADFQRQVKSVLSDINALMASSDQGLIGTQTLAVQHYADVLPSLAKIFPPVEIAQMIIAFADTLTSAKGSMAIYKLLLLLQVVKSVFDSAASRGLLIPALVRWVKPHFGKYEEGFGQAGEEKAKDMKRIKWMECNRLAVTVSQWQEWR